MKAHIQIVGWNHYQYIGTCVLLCQKQTAQVPIIYIDNASKDESVVYVKNNYPDVKIIENKDNRGYAGGHNDGIKAMPDSDVVICLNPDVVLEKDFVEKILRQFEGDEKVGAVVPLLFRNKERDKKGQMRIIIDSFGTQLKHGINVTNIMEGKYWEEASQLWRNVGADVLVRPWEHEDVLPYDSVARDIEMPWGFTGAAVAISRKAIDDLKDEQGNFFDEDLHSYREDVDASWRLNNSGWKIIGALDARGWHARNARKGEKKSARIAQLSWRNFFLVAIKDIPDKVIVDNLIYFVLYFLARIGQFVVSPVLWSGLPQLVKLVPIFLKKRQSAL